MRRMNLLKTLLCPVLILTFCVTHVFPQPASTDSPERRMVFLGLLSKNLPETVHNDIRSRFLQMFRGNQSLEVVETAELAGEPLFGQVNQLLADMNLPELRRLALKNNIDHLFWARLEGNQQQSLQIRGTMYRYDAVTEKLHQYNFQTGYERIGNELAAFKSKYVDPVTKPKSALNLKSALAIAGLLLVSILVFGSNKAGSSGAKKEQTGSTDE